MTINGLMPQFPNSLTSYLNNGLIPDPNFGDQQLQISDEYFTANFWYKNSFVIPENYVGKIYFFEFRWY